MKGYRAIPLLLAATLAVGGVQPGHAAAGNARARSRAEAVVALIDSGVNPYSSAFRDTSRRASRHPSTYIPGYPARTPALRLTLDVPYDQAVEADAELWKSVKPETLYWIPGTRIIGAISFGDGGTNCPFIEAPPANSVNGSCTEHTILDDHGHGTMTASRAAGAPSSLGSAARIVAIEGLGATGVRWAADAGWIDVQSNSWLSLVPPPTPQPTTRAFSYAASRMLTLAASGNGTAYLAGVAPTPTYLLSTAPPGVVLVGAHDNGKVTAWAGAPPHVVADGYSGYTAIRDSNEVMRPDPIACCTSAASPYAAGGTIAIVREARKILGDDSTGIHDGVVAQGRPGLVASGPLVDGVLTLNELKDLVFHSAEALPAEGRDDGEIHWAGDPRPPDYLEYGAGANPFCQGCTTTPVEWQRVAGPDPYAFVGYGAINERSVGLARGVLRGRAQPHARSQADKQYALDQLLRSVVFALN